MPAMTFSRITPGTFDPLTEVTTGATVTTVSGEAIVVRGDPQRYRALGLNLATMPTVLFTPTTYALRSYTTDFVQPGDTTTLNGLALTVRDVSPIGPDGNVIAARIILSA